MYKCADFYPIKSEVNILSNELFHFHDKKKKKQNT